MIEMNYSKKQIKPIIEKYNIAVETDENFREIILMFNGQTNYQIWALKLFYNNICSIAVLARIRDWAIENPTEIKNLIRSEIDSKVNAENGFRACERIYSFSILSESFKVGEELSGKQEYMRHKINAKYKKKIELLFQDK